MLSNPLLLIPYAAIFIVVGYGLLKMGRVINLKLQAGRDRRWIIYLAALLGVTLLFSEYLAPVDPEYTRAGAALLIVPAVATLINYKGK